MESLETLDMVMNVGALALAFLVALASALVLGASLAPFNPSDSKVARFDEALAGVRARRLATLALVERSFLQHSEPTRSERIPRVAGALARREGIELATETEPTRPVRVRRDTPPRDSRGRFTRAAPMIQGTA